MKYLGLNIASIISFWIRTQLATTRYYAEHMIPNIRLIHETMALRGTCSGKNAFVFANGPSMKKLDPDKVLNYKKRGYDVFAVNSYINTDFGNEVSPNYYIFSDPAHFGFNLEKLSDKRRQEVVDDLQKVMGCNATLFVPLQFYKYLDYGEKHAICDAENYFSNNIADITRPRGYMSMTAYKALSIACFLGYDSICICGFDNSYFKSISVDKDNNLYYNDEHYYPVSQPADLKYRVSHEGKSVGELLYTHHFLFKQLEKYKHYPIINLDEASLVDAFIKHHDLDVYMR